MVKLKPKDKLVTYVTLAVTPEMKAAFKKVAAKHDLSMSEFLRQLALDFLEIDAKKTGIPQENRNGEE
jgi:hypothetical protein